MTRGAYTSSSPRCRGFPRRTRALITVAEAGRYVRYEKAHSMVSRHHWIVIALSVLLLREARGRRGTCRRRVPRSHRADVTILAEAMHGAREMESLVTIPLRAHQRRCGRPRVRSATAVGVGVIWWSSIGEPTFILPGSWSERTRAGAGSLPPQISVRCSPQFPRSWARSVFCAVVRKRRSADDADCRRHGRAQAIAGRAGCVAGDANGGRGTALPGHCASRGAARQRGVVTELLDAARASSENASAASH